MERAREIKDFLSTRRAKVAPEQVGLPAGSRRRVAGLRREEVATLAGISVEYYVRIERGNLAGVSDEVLAAIAHALRLDDAETTHLFDMARGADPRPVRRSRAHPSAASRVPETVQALIDTMVMAPVIVQNGRLDIVGANALGRALYADLFAGPPDPPNVARFVFLDERADRLFADWPRAADDAVGLLHVEAARSGPSTAVSGLVGELATRSQDFRRRWAAHDVRAHRQGTKTFRHAAVGELTLRYEVLEVVSAPGLVVVGYTPEPGSPSAETLRLLSTWAATEPAPAR